MVEKHNYIKAEILKECLKGRLTDPTISWINCPELYIYKNTCNTIHRSLAVDKWNSWDSSSVTVTSSSINHCLALLSCIKSLAQGQLLCDPSSVPKPALSQPQPDSILQASTTCGPVMKKVE